MKRSMIMALGATVLPGCYAGPGSDSNSDGSGLDTLTAGADVETTGAPESGGPDDDGDDDDDGGDSGSPTPEGEGPAELPVGRAIRRMTADQFVRSLERATTQRWDGFEAYSAAMGKANFSEITEHDRNLSVTFEKFATDAAIATCRAAVELDAGENTQTILRHATLEDLDESAVRANVQYLVLRFLADEVELDDPRVDVWAELVLAPMGADLEPRDILRERWAAVCVGLATHVDFITY